MTIGEKIQINRKSLGLSQEQLGEKVGVSRQAVSKWEQGTAMPELDKVITLSKVFSISTDDLLGNTDAEKDKYSNNVSIENNVNDTLNNFKNLLRKNWHRGGYLFIIWGCIALAMSLGVASSWRKMHLPGMMLIGQAVERNLFVYAMKQPLVQIIIPIGIIAIIFGTLVIIYGTIKNKK